MCECVWLPFNNKDTKVWSFEMVAMFTGLRMDRPRSKATMTNWGCLRTPEQPSASWVMDTDVILVKCRRSLAFLIRKQVIFFSGYKEHFWWFGIIFKNKSLAILNLLSRHFEERGTLTPFLSCSGKQPPISSEASSTALLMCCHCLPWDCFFSPNQYELWNHSQFKIPQSQRML